ncbi:hypothetical protein BDW72DRAFT_199686 [Aspergillus terricola var. indicus]
MNQFFQRRQAIEAEGVYVCGWSFHEAFIVNKTDDGRHDTSEDRVEHCNAVEEDWNIWTVNLSNVKVLQSGTPNSITTSLELKGVEFNWAYPVQGQSSPSIVQPQYLYSIGSQGSYQQG